MKSQSPALALYILLHTVCKNQTIILSQHLSGLVSFVFGSRVIGRFSV